ncbi:MAG: hypothetical protein QM485_07325 [Flavobacteriaceae bacterium]
MSSTVIKGVKLSLLVLMPLFLISSSKLDDFLEPAPSFEGSYSLWASGNLNQELKGVIRFETGVEMAGDRTSFSVLELKLNNDSDTIRHSMGFLISRQNQSHEITIGTYRVAEDIDKLLSDFDGVFGFANVDIMGELPFFAQRGRIVITRLTQNVLEGSIMVTLRNSSKKTIKVNGYFKAIR